MLGFETDGKPGTVQFGPQPYEGRISVICEAFGCTPAAAEEQDPALVDAVLDYRHALIAKRLWSATTAKEQGRNFEILAENTHLLVLLGRMRRAQTGEPLDADADELAAEGLGHARRQAVDPDDEQT